MDRCLVNALFGSSGGDRKKKFLSSLWCLPLTLGLPSDSTFKPENGPCALKQRFSTDDNDPCAAGIILQLAPSKGVLTAARREGKVLTVTLVVTREERPRPNWLPTLEVTQRGARYKHTPSLCLFCPLGPEMALSCSPFPHNCL